MNVRVLAVLAAGSLLLSTSGLALAGGSIGGTSGGADEFVLPGSEEDQAGAADGNVAP